MRIALFSVLCGIAAVALFSAVADGALFGSFRFSSRGSSLSRTSRTSSISRTPSSSSIFGSRRTASGTQSRTPIFSQPRPQGGSPSIFRQPRATVRPAIFRQTRPQGAANPTPPLWLRPVTQARMPVAGRPTQPLWLRPVTQPPRFTLGPRPPSVTVQPLDPRKQAFFQSLRNGCSRDKFTCAMTGLDLALTGVDIGMTVTDFVRAGMENKLYNDRIEAEKKEAERQRQLAIQDQEVFLDKFRQIQQGAAQQQGAAAPNPPDVYPDSVCNHAAIAAQNQGSPYFQCPLAQNADNENRCCGDPGEQTCCADPAVDPPFLSEIDGQAVCSNSSVAQLNDGSPYFVCPLLDNADYETECCGQPGKQNCCALN